jgi:hypothetical protein
MARRLLTRDGRSVSSTQRKTFCCCLPFTPSDPLPFDEKLQGELAISRNQDSWYVPHSPFLVGILLFLLLKFSHVDPFRRLLHFTCRDQVQEFKVQVFHSLAFAIDNININDVRRRTPHSYPYHGHHGRPGNHYRSYNQREEVLLFP